MANPPPCNNTNIEAVVSCGSGASTTSVTVELFTSSNSLVACITENESPYYLFGNSESDINDGRIPPGTYKIRSKMNGVTSPFTTFTLGGKCT